MKQQPPVFILATTLALLATSTTVHASLEFKVPNELSIGAETTIDWIGEPSLGISEQSVVLFKDDKPLVTLCQGLISGSGQCTFTLNEGDVKTLQRGNEGYHLGLQGGDGLTLDVSGNFAIRSEAAEEEKHVEDQGEVDGDDARDGGEETGEEEDKQGEEQVEENGEDARDDSEEVGKEDDKQTEEQGEENRENGRDDGKEVGEEEGEDQDKQEEGEDQGEKNNEDVQDDGKEEKREEEMGPSTNETENEDREDGEKSSHRDDENEDEALDDGHQNDNNQANEDDYNANDEQNEKGREHEREKARKQKEQTRRKKALKKMQDKKQKNWSKNESEDSDGHHEDRQETAEDAKSPLPADAVINVASATVFSTVPTPTSTVDASSGITSVNAPAATPAIALAATPSYAAAAITTSGSTSDATADTTPTPATATLTATSNIVLATNEGVKKDEAKTERTITDGENDKDVKSHSHTEKIENKKDKDEIRQTWTQLLEYHSAFTKNVGSSISNSFPDVKLLVFEDTSASSGLSQSGSNEL